ncbi:MerR family transcriptional regulator [Paenibacillus sp. GYB003]|uniref:MerR family transcriptional regulator n=1 Tax=Paenibacillus sp. GYB003 TaxID=2994392 RepID=UPI002F96BBB8
MRIKETAEKLRISPRAIRFYEQKGLIAPLKDGAGGYRRFDDDDMARLQMIVALREAGLGLDDIRQALPAQGEPGSAQGELIRHLELKRAEMAAAWIELKETIETADSMLSLLAREKALPVEAMFRLAQEAKRVRELRGGWRDRWDYDRLADTHDSVVGSNSGEYTDYDRALDLIVTWISAVPGEEGLDLGTGTGNLAGRLMRRGAKMAGVDQSRAMLDRCRAKFPEMETKVGNLLAVPYTSEKFDFVVSSFALRHLEDGQRRLALEETIRVLKPRGRICIADRMPAGERTPEREGRPERPPDGQNPLASVTEIAEFFEARHYVVKIKRLNDLLHVVYAVPIR